jgi:tRNA U38,U39,U40 pseudouridine synthase TruA
LLIDVQDASKSFDAKARTTNRTYYYYIPAFCLNNSFFSLINVKLKNEVDEVFMKDIYNDLKKDMIIDLMNEYAIYDKLYAQEVSQ